jgi:hypothetical protein
LSKLHVPVSSGSKNQSVLERIYIGCVAKTQESHAADKAVTSANLIEGLLRLGDHGIGHPVARAHKECHRLVPTESGRRIDCGLSAPDSNWDCPASYPLLTPRVREETQGFRPARGRVCEVQRHSCKCNFSLVLIWELRRLPPYDIQRAPNHAITSLCELSACSK